jgi:hypothetical protein
MTQLYFYTGSTQQQSESSFLSEHFGHLIMSNLLSGSNIVNPQILSEHFGHLIMSNLLSDSNRVNPQWSLWALDYVEPSFRQDQSESSGNTLGTWLCRTFQTEYSLEQMTEWPVSRLEVRLLDWCLNVVLSAPTLTKGTFRCLSLSKTMSLSQKELTNISSTVAM